MTRLTEITNGSVAVIGTIFTFLFGGWDVALNTLVVLMALDYITGLIKGYVNKNLNSEVGIKGLFKKLFILIILIIAVALDRMSCNGEHIFRTLVAFFYISNESLSIIENAAELGVPIPRQIKDALEQLKNNDLDKKVR